MPVPIHQSVKGVSDGELGGPFSPVRAGEKKVICFWLTKWDMIQKPDIWLTEDRGMINTTPIMKYLSKYFGKKNVKGYSVASGSLINLYFEESVSDIWGNNAFQKFLWPHVLCTEMSHTQFPETEKIRHVPKLAFTEPVSVYACLQGLVIHLDYRWTN